jgi:hypothetical protein
MRLSENAHLPFDKPFDKLTVLSKVEGLMALSKAEGLRYPHPSSLRAGGTAAYLYDSLTVEAQTFDGGLSRCLKK